MQRPPSSEGNSDPNSSSRSPLSSSWSTGVWYPDPWNEFKLPTRVIGAISNELEKSFHTQKFHKQKNKTRSFNFHRTKHKNCRVVEQNQGTKKQKY